MASNLVILTQDDRRMQLKTTPSMLLKDVLVQACTHFNLSPIEYYELRLYRPIKKNTAPLDLSLAIRLANLPPGTKLNIVRTLNPFNTDGPIRVALQLDSGERVIQSYPGSTRLWDVLLQTEKQAGLNLTRRQGHPKDQSSSILGQLSAKFGEDKYMIPVLIVANKEYASLNELRNTTLASIGSRATSMVIRLVFKYSDMSLEQVLSQIQAYLPPVDEDKKIASANSDMPTDKPVDATEPFPSPGTGPQQPLDAVEPNYASKPQIEVNRIGSLSPVDSSVQSFPVPVIQHIAHVPDASNGQQEFSSGTDEQPVSRNPILYQPPSELSLTKIHIPDSFFKLTSTELKSILASQQRRRQQLENTPLKTTAMREREDIQHRSKFPKTLIRVKCPDEYLLQLTFLTEEKVSNLYSTIQTLFSPNIEQVPTFRIVTSIPNVRDLNPEDDFWTAQLAPASVVRILGPWLLSTPVYFDLDKVGPVVQLPNKPVDPRDYEGSDTPVEEDVGAGENEVERTASLYSASHHHSSSSKTTSTTQPEKKKVPKWFRPFK